MINHLIKYLRYKQTIRYLSIGLINNTLGYVIFILLVEYGFEPKIAVTLLYFFNLSFSFLGNNSLVFPTKNNIFSVATKYIIAHFSSYVLNLYILQLFVNRLNYPYQLVQACSIIIIAFLLLIVFKYIVFKDPSHGIDNKSPE